MGPGTTSWGGRRCAAHAQADVAARRASAAAVVPCRCAGPTLRARSVRSNALCLPDAGTGGGVSFGSGGVPGGIAAAAHARRRRCGAAAFAAAATPGGAQGAPAGAAGDAGDEAARYPLLLAILLRLSAPGGEAQLDAFLRAQLPATAVPFISWVADLEARAASREERAALEALCERLVVAREQLEAERMDALYADTLQLLAGGDEQREALVLSQPEAYATQLAEALTGAPVVREGYSPVYDALLRAAPPAALTPAGVAKAHQEAKELAEDMRARRRRSFAAVIGRMRITSPEQEAALLAPSAPARILDLLLSLQTEGEREALLPDCFTPPPEEAGDGSGGSGGDAAAPGAGGDASDTDELWCTPPQLLNEVDARLAALAGSGARGGGAAQQALPGGGHGLSRPAYEAALRHLRGAVAERWMQSLPGGGGGGSSGSTAGAPV